MIRAVFLCMLILSGTVSLAQDTLRPMKAVRVLNPPKIDGVLDEDVWITAAPANTFIQADPDYKVPSSQKTEVRILYDNEAIYIPPNKNEPMRKLILLFLSTLCPLLTIAQNGFSTYPLPSQYTPYQYRGKNDLKIDHNAVKWVCYSSLGLGKYNGSWTLYNPSNSGLPSVKTFGIDFDASNKAWIGTDSGAVSFDGTSWVRFTTANSGILSNTVYAVNVQGTNIYFGTNKGISVWNGTVWKSYTTINTGLICDTVKNLATEPNGTLWAGTPKGLSENKSGIWSSFTTQNSALKENTINCIYIDPYSIKWVGTTRTAYRIAGNALVPIASFVNPLFYSSNPPGIFSICEGPHNGIAFGLAGGTNAHGIVEIGGQKNYEYSYYSAQYMCYDKSTAELWFTTNILDSTHSGLASLNASQYSGAWLGFNFENYQLLDVNEVSTPILNRGDMHWDMTSAQYEVPKGSGKHADFAASLWIGGLDGGGKLHEAAMTYRQNGYDYWPGPLDTIHGSTDSAKAGSYDKVWKVDRFKIEEFKLNFQRGNVQNGTYTPQDGILNWPARGQGNFSRKLAPFVDVNHNGVYDPLAGGDYPQILGDQEIYRIFNDQLTTHTETQGAPLQVEVHAAAYAYYCPNISDSDKVLNYTTFYHYEVINRSTNTYSKAYVGGWQDVDLGNYTDDYVGCNPKGNYGYVYNGALCDGSGLYESYGCHPPMMSTVILNGPLAEPGDGIDNNNNGVTDEPGEHNLMTGFHPYFNDYGAMGNPGQENVAGGPSSPRPGDYYNYLHNRWRDSTDVTYGGNGYGGTTPTRFMFPGMPYDTTQWSEYSSHNNPGDRRFLISCGPFTLKPDSTVSFDYALVFTRDTTLAPQSKAFFDKNESDVLKVQRWWEQNNAPSCLPLNVGIQEKTLVVPQLEVFPNPFSDQLTVHFNSQTGSYSIFVMDLTGKEVLSQKQLSNGVHELNLGSLSEGMYFLQVRDGNEVKTCKIIKR